MTKIIKTSVIAISLFIFISLLTTSYFYIKYNKWHLIIANKTNQDITFVTNYCSSSDTELKVPKNSSENFSCYSAITNKKHICADKIGCTYIQHEFDDGFIGGSVIADISVSTNSFTFDSLEQWKAKLGSTNKETVLSIIELNKNNTNSETYGYLKNIDTRLRQDEEVIFAVLKYRPKEITLIDQHIKDHEFIFKALETNPSILSHLNDQSKKTMNVAMQRDIKLFARLNKILLNDFDYVKTQVMKDGLNIQFASDRLKQNKDIVLLAVKQNGRALQYAGDTLKNDTEIALAAIKNTVHSIEFAGKDIKKKKEIALITIKDYPPAIRYFDPSIQNDEDVLKIILDEVKREITNLSYIQGTSVEKNKSFMLSAIKLQPRIFYSLSNEFQKDEDIVLVAVKHNGRLLKTLDPKLKNHKKIVLTAISNDANAIRYASKALQKDHDVLLLAAKNKTSFIDEINIQSINNKEIVMEVLKYDVDLIHYMDSKFKNDRDVMLLAITKSHENLLFTPLPLRLKRQFSLDAVKLNGLALEFIGSRYEPKRSIVYDLGRKNNPLKNDIEIILAAVKQNGLALRHAPIELRRDKNVVFEAVKQNPKAIEFAVGTDVTNEVYNMQQRYKSKLNKS
ncbi:hypothetical protein GCM10009133_17070 [Cocleimonas flava]|uniref:Uncharacterized protein DUF4116 n=1 Tax=Cocleimonas flava TaxID=634765 RepID=A0A4R1ETS4_9GAMM|nr:DUF4116 domain-containing protein [Cocleimonas flava]TCJ84633.1 uncharacterized protein DUF4116 [Cocleimonas flava]